MVQLVSLVHAPGTQRAQARARIRTALRELAAQQLQLGIERIALQCAPGAAPRLLVDGAASIASVSLAHDGLLSVAAFHAHGPVGIDVMQVQHTDDWQRVARDYLGPRVLAMLGAAAPPERALRFAGAWTEREACLKCLGLGLAEWAELPGQFHTQALNLPAGYAGTVAVRQAPDKA